MTTRENYRRVFRYGDKSSRSWENTVEQVLQHLKGYFPELGHAKIEERHWMMARWKSPLASR